LQFGTLTDVLLEQTGHPIRSKNPDVHNETTDLPCTVYIAPVAV